MYNDACFGFVCYASDVNVVSNIRDPNTGEFIGLYGTHVESFHSDLSYNEIPSKATLLLSRIRPDNCGNTQFVDSTAAYGGMGAAMRASYEGRRARYCYLTSRKAEESGLTEEVPLTPHMNRIYI